MKYTEEGIEFTDTVAEQLGSDQMLPWADTESFLPSLEQRIWQAHLDIDELALAKDGVSARFFLESSQRIALFSGVYDAVQTEAIGRGVLPNDTPPRNLVAAL